MKGEDCVRGCRLGKEGSRRGAGRGAAGDGRR